MDDSSPKKPELFRLISEKDTFYTKSWDDILLAANIVYIGKKFIVTMEIYPIELIYVLYDLPSPYDPNQLNTTARIPTDIRELTDKAYKYRETGSFLEFHFNKHGFRVGQREYYGWFVTEPQIVWDRTDV